MQPIIFIQRILFSNFSKIIFTLIIIFSSVAQASAQDSSKVRKNEIWLATNVLTYKRAVSNQNYLTISLHGMGVSLNKNNDSQIFNNDNNISKNEKDFKIDRSYYHGNFLLGIGIERKNELGKNFVSYVGPQLSGGYTSFLSRADSTQHSINKQYRVALGMTMALGYEITKRWMVSVQLIPYISSTYSNAISKSIAYYEGTPAMMSQSKSKGNALSAGVSSPIYSLVYKF